MKLVQPNKKKKILTNPKTMLVDLSNLCWIQRFSEFKQNDLYDPDAWALIFQNVVGKISKVASKYDVDRIILCDEGSNNWRKDIYPDYKANRSVELDVYFDDIIYAKDQIKEFFRDCSNHFYVSINRMEADDLIAIYSQEYKDCDQLIVLMSTDKDFLQLLDSPNVVQFDPVKFEEKAKVDEQERSFQLFLKCIRGDNGDNIPSAYPRVREKKLREAWEDEYLMINIMNHPRKEDQVPVRDVFYRNQRLIDLTQQPEHLRKEVKSAFEMILNTEENQQYDYVKAKRWLKNKELYTLSENLESHLNILK